ncbi:ATPase-like protein [Naviculisporaceae sp. PSN 640]
MEEQIPATSVQEVGYFEAGVRVNKRPWTRWTLAVLFSTLATAVLGIVAILLWRDQDIAQVCIVPVVPSLVSALIIVLDRPRTLPGAVLTINMALLLTELAIFTVVPGTLGGGGWPAVYALVGGLALPMSSLVVLLNMPMRDPLLNSDDIGKPFATPSYNVRSPEDIITLWQWLTVSWMAPLMSIGYKRQLHDQDVWKLAYEFQHDRLHNLFRHVTGSVLVRLFKANGFDLIIATSADIMVTLSNLTEPVLLKQLLAALTGEIPDHRTAVIYAAMILFARLLRAQLGVFVLWFGRRNYERARGEMITMLHEKTLRRKAFTFPSNHTEKLEQGVERQTEQSNISEVSTLMEGEGSESGDELLPKTSQDGQVDGPESWYRRLYKMIFSPAKKDLAEDGPASMGKILNLLRGDAYEVAQRFWEFPSLVTIPLNLVVCVVLIWRILGPASLSGILVLLAGMVVNVFLLRQVLAVERVRRAITDTKLQRTSQFVESIRHLRWYDWQDSWLAQIMESRHAELMKRVTSSLIVRLIAAINLLTAYLFPVAGFLAYTLIAKKPLTVDVAFPALSLFNLLQANLREVPNLITTLLNASVSRARIEKFMLEPDKDDLPEDEMSVGPPAELKIVIKDASFSWPGSSKKILRNVSFECIPGLTVVCGKVGIGKTALLQAILGELDQYGGEKSVQHEMIGYCAQTPWLESMSIRENILFSTVFDEARYWQVMEACCLVEDMNKFKDKDLTMIGENGVGLSGGQRARVSLARAVYSRARILLLDDPIAALDHQTAESILRNLFGSKDSPLTSGRLIIFVTHRVDIITPYAMQVLDVVDRGRVKSIKREELLSNEEELEELVAQAAPETAQFDTPDDSSQDKPPEQFMEEERRAHGGVLAGVYWQYVKAGGYRWWVALVTATALFRLGNYAYFWFLKEWGDRYISDSEASVSHPMLRLTFQTPALTRQNGDLDLVSRYGGFYITRDNNWLDLGRYLPSPDVNVHPWLFWFFALSVVQVVAQTLNELTLIVIVYKAGKNLFERAMKRVSSATFRFYDVTPVGRLMNRLTSDMGTIDGSIAQQLMQVTWFAISWLSSIIVIASATPLFLVLSIGMSAMFVLVFDRFLPTSQSLRRLETVSLSPLMSNFGTLMEGLTTVRAYKAEPHFQRRIIATTDAFQKMDHIYWSAQAWLQYRFDLLSSLTTFALTLTAIFGGLSGGTVGFILAAASNFVMSAHSLCRCYGEMQMQFVSVERVIELLGLEQEDPGSEKPPASWPAYGDDIEFDNVTLRYAPGLEPVLVGVSFTIPGGSNVAVTGRTGSGKSTLALSLLGTLHPDAGTGGGIRIGNVDLSRVDKHALRRNITFVAQDPVLFPGTLRDNLDPLDEHDEAERALVLERVLGRHSHPSAADEGHHDEVDEEREGEHHAPEFTLDSRVDGGGKNLSQGQRQLVGLGRAILRRSPVVIMDEATASIDVETARYIQRLLREELKYSTVITIAHKAEAVRDADWEIVLDRGRVIRAGPRGSGPQG